MNPTEKHFHQQQSRLRRSQGKAIRAVSSRPLFCPELVGIESKSNIQRMANYERKRALGGKMNTNWQQVGSLFSLMDHINEAYAADASPSFDLDHRWYQITVTQGGRTIYAATLEIDNPAIEAKARLIREELEMMIAECELPICHTGAAA